MSESTPSKGAGEPLGELRKRLRGWWQRASAQAALAARWLPPRTVLRSLRETNLRRMVNDDDGLPVRSDEVPGHRGSTRGNAPRGVAETTVECRAAPHAAEVLALLRESLLRVATVGRGASRRASSGVGPIRVDRIEEAADSTLARTLRALQAELPAERDAPSLGFDSPSLPRATRSEPIDERSDWIEPLSQREASLRDPRWREVSEAQHELADALERLQRRPSQWSA